MPTDYPEKISIDAQHGCQGQDSACEEDEIDQELRAKNGGEGAASDVPKMYLAIIEMLALAWIDFGEEAPIREIAGNDDKGTSFRREADRHRFVLGLHIVLKAVPSHHGREAYQEGQQPAEDHDDHHPAFSHMPGIAVQQKKQVSVM